MNNDIYIAAATWAKRDECEHLARDPGFRKATVPMMMAWQALEKALSQLTADLERLDCKTWGLVFGTSHGELEVTKDFLVTFASKGLARPILFQNSLHHSTLGFISLKLGISGPGMTVSNHFFSGEDAVTSAMDLIAGGSCDIAVTVAVDALVDTLAGALGQYYPNGFLKEEGAGCLILANEVGLKKLGVEPLAALNEIDCHYQPLANVPNQTEQTLIVASDYDSDAIEKISRYLMETRNQPKSSLVLQKPDGSFSSVRWSHNSQVTGG